MGCVRFCGVCSLGFARDGKRIELSILIKKQQLANGKFDYFSFIL